jgi:hypothetical protein
MRAIERSTVFMVPMRNRFSGRVNSSCGEYCRLTGSLRPEPLEEVADGGWARPWS